LSAIFGAVHYFFKPMETVADALSVGLLGLFMCFTVRQTGAIWFAVGFHALFDYAAIFMFGAPNSGNGGNPVSTKLLTGVYRGPAWLTGGPLGVEASWLVFPVIAFLFLGFSLLRYNPPLKQNREEHHENHALPRGLRNSSVVVRSRSGAAEDDARGKGADGCDDESGHAG